MSEELTREIIGLSHKSKWVRVKEFIKIVVEKTLKEDTGYFVLALDAVIKKKRQAEYDVLITKEEHISEIDKVDDFSSFSLYQISDTTNDHISVSKEDNVIIVLSKFFGPEVEHAKFFDFTVHMDSLNNPFFSDATGNIISCSEMLNLVEKIKKEVPIKKPVKKVPAKKEPAKKAPIKKTPAKKVPAKKKPVKKAPSKKVPAKKKPVKKAPSKKVPVKKKPVKKAPSKKAPAKKKPAKKTPTKKSPAKKSTAKSKSTKK